MPDAETIEKRLREKHPASGNYAMKANGSLINPDGPEAADLIASLRADRDALREALAFYAYHDNWLESMWLTTPPCRKDKGDIARTALADHISDVREMVAEDAADERRAIADWLLRKADACSVESIEGTLRMAAEAIDMGAHREQADG